MNKLNYDNGAWTDNGFCRNCAVKDGCLRECRFAECYRKGYDEAADMAIKWISDNVMDYCDIFSYVDFMTAFENAVRRKGADDDAE